MEIIIQIVLILGISYTGLTLYFQHRWDKKHKEFKNKLK